MKSLGVADEHIAVGDQITCEPAENALLRRPVEVDDHVAAEDGIGPGSQTVVIVHEIEAAELDRLAQLGNHAHPVGVAVAAAHKVLSAQRGRHRCNRMLLRSPCG